MTAELRPPSPRSSDSTADTTSSADAIAAALMAAAPSARADCWARGASVAARDLAWALKRACDAAWTTDPAKTRVAAELSDELALQRPDPEIDALAAWTRGRALLLQGQMEAALAELDAAGEAFAALGLWHERAQTQVVRVMALAMLGRFDDALACGAQARAAFDAVGDALWAGKVELNLGNLSARRDRAEPALRHFEEARRRFVAAADVELEIMAVFGMAELAAQKHEFEPAAALYEEARRSAERGGFALLIASIDGDLGALEMRRGRYDVALRHLERSRRGYAGLDVPHYLAVAEESLADAYLELNLLPEALSLYERSLASYEVAGLVTDRAWALSQRGRVLTLLGREAAAARSLQDAESAFAGEQNATGAALVRLWQAELALRRHDWETAVRYARDAEARLLAARQMSRYLHARNLLAEALRGAGDTSQAEQLAQSTTQHADALMLPPAQRHSRLLLGLLARDRGDAAAARRCFEAVVDSIESQRGSLPGEEFRAAFLGHNLFPYHALVRSCLDAGGPHAAEHALHWIERARARSLADALDTHGDDAGDERADPSRREVARLRLRLDDCYRALLRPRGDADAADLDPPHDEVARIEAALLEAGRRSALADDASVHAGAGAAFEPAALHGALGEHTALVEYFSIDDALLVCIVAGGAVSVVPLPARLADVQAMIEQLRFQTDTLRHGTARLAHRMPELMRRTLHHLQRLHAALWAPLGSRLGSRRAVVVPHGVLHYLPFEALHDGTRHEIERRELCRAPSAAVLLRCLQRPTERFDRALVLGHADARLPQVNTELQAVAARFPNAQVLQDGAARGDALRASQGPLDVLHIACHAQFRHDSPRFSALHLADGAFTVRDAARLQLHGGLVTLSACETGISAVMPGDELIGLTHAFICAGAARVLASLWTVQDASAADFMPHYYTRLRAGCAPAQALRETQLDTLHAHPHPYSWAAFTLHGGW